MAQRKNWHPERIKATIEAMRKKKTGSYKASSVFHVPQTKLERYIKPREKSLKEVIKEKLCRKQVLP
jgi:predicted nucleotidyltransferase